MKTRVRPREDAGRTSGGVFSRPPVLLTLLLLAFAAGGLTAWIVLPSLVPTSSSVQATVAPAAPTSLAPTSTPPPTPTPTAPDLGDLLETLYIDIAPDDFAQIEAKRQEALKRWILLADGTDFVPATLRWHGDVIPVELRLKGDWADHFAHDKWSFRIRTESGTYFEGIRVFSLQDPSTRTYLNEWLYLENLRAEGVLGVRYWFVHGVVNGEYKGIYAVEESFAKELLESQQRREGVVIRYDEDLLWEYWAAYDNDLVTPRGVMNFHMIDEFESGRVDASPALSAQRDAAAGKLRALETGEQAASQVFDVETLAKFLALSDVWGAQHALIWHNLRFYYNPVTSRLEPIGFDAQPLAETGAIDVNLLRGLRKAIAYDDVALQQAYTRYLWQFSQPDYLTFLEQRFGAELETLRAALSPEFGDQQTADGRGVLDTPWTYLAQRQASLREMLSPLQMTYVHVPAGALTDALTLHVGNLLDFPVEVVGLRVDETLLPAHEWNVVASERVAEIDSAVALRPLPLDATFMPYARFEIPATVWASHATHTETLSLETRLLGLTQTVTQPVIAAYPLPVIAGPRPAQPTLAEALAKHPFLRESSDARTLTIPPGVWDVEGNLLLPDGYGLRLAPGTTLAFGPENFLLATGPLIFEGAEDAPVVLRPQGEKWRGIVVIDAGQPSLWRYVTVEDTDAIDREGWVMTGGITFYRSPLRLDHSRILRTRAEDGLNVIRAHFEFVDSEFSGTSSDAFDGDFTQGVIERCAFHDIGADAIDVSGSDVHVRDVRMINLGDKGLSVGEMSSLTAEHVFITNADFGMASKDLSQAHISDVTLEDIRIAGLAAYIKKPSYGPASITAEGITFVDVPAEQHTLVQTGSWIDLDGARIWGVDVDVEALYEKWR
ncbi:MAG: CotH kinase family protein [Anaerolineae bacterium]